MPHETPQSSIVHLTDAHSATQISTSEHWGLFEVGVVSRLQQRTPSRSFRWHPPCRHHRFNSIVSGKYFTTWNRSFRITSLLILLKKKSNFLIILRKSNWCLGLQNRVTCLHYAHWYVIWHDIFQSRTFLIHFVRDGSKITCVLGQRGFKSFKIWCYDPTIFSGNDSWPIFCAMAQHTKLQNYPTDCIISFFTLLNLKRSEPWEI